MIIQYADVVRLYNTAYVKDEKRYVTMKRKKNLLRLFIAAILFFSQPFILSAATQDEALHNENTKTIKIQLRFNNKSVTATLQNNATTRSLIKKLPFTLPMLDRYSRELVYRFEKPFPTDNVTVRNYTIGEIIYYPPLHSLVILYDQNGEQFSMQRLGHIDDGIELFEQTGDVSVTFERFPPNR